MGVLLELQGDLGLVAGQRIRMTSETCWQEESDVIVIVILLFNPF